MLDCTEIPAKLEDGDPSHRARGLWPFLSRHVWDRETVETLTGKQQGEEVEGKRQQGGRGPMGT